MSVLPNSVERFCFVLRLPMCSFQDTWAGYQSWMKGDLWRYPESLPWDFSGAELAVRKRATQKLTLPLPEANSHCPTPTLPPQGGVLQRNSSLPFYFHRDTTPFCATLIPGETVCPYVLAFYVDVVQTVQGSFQCPHRSRAAGWSSPCLIKRPV